MNKPQRPGPKIALRLPEEIYIDSLAERIGAFGAIVGKDLNGLEPLITAQLNGEEQLRVETDADATIKMVTERDGWKRLVPCTLCLATGCHVDDCAIVAKLHVHRTPKGLKPYRGELSFWAEHEATGQRYPLRRPPYVANLKECCKLASQVLEDVDYKDAHKMIRFELMTEADPIIVLSDGYRKPFSLRLIQTDDESGAVRIDCAPLLRSPNCPKQYHVLSYAAYHDEESLRVLADLAQPEDTPYGWANRLEDGNRVDRDNLDGLCHYLMNVVARLYDDERVTPGSALIRYDGGARLCFCTGLVGRASGRYIYGVCGDRDADGVYHSVKWVENDFHGTIRDPLLPPEADNKNHGLPFPADWTREPAALICRYTKIGKVEDHINWNHILHDRRERLTSIRFADLTPSDPKWEAAARQEILRAIYEARKKVQGNYRYVMPGFYKGKITIQLPLCLGGGNVPNAYLVLVDQGPEKPYRAPTLLTPAMAYNNARAISPQERSAWEESLFRHIRLDMDLDGMD